MNSHSFRMVLATIAATASISSLLAQSPIQTQQALREVANQRAESETREGVAQAEKLARSHPDKAVRDLKLIARGLDLRTEITSAKREELIALVNGKIAIIERGGIQPTVPNRDPIPPRDPVVAARDAETKKRRDAFEIEAKEVNEAVSAIARDYEAGQPHEAGKRIAELGRKYPTNPASIYLQGAGSTNERISYAKLLAKEQSDRFVTAMNQVQESALPAVRDVEFPKGWKEKMELRRKLEPQLYGAEEMKILETLDKPVNLKVKDAPFEESIQLLSTTLDLPFYLDKQSLDDLAVDMKKPVTVPANVTARTALRTMLQPAGLTFIIKDKVLQIVSIEKSRQNYVTRSYDVSDIVRSGGTFNSPVLWGPFLDLQQTQQNAQILMDMIQKSIDPMIWQQPGGGSITFHYPSMSLVIRAPSEVHASLGKSLKR